MHHRFSELKLLVHAISPTTLEPAVTKQKILMYHNSQITKIKRLKDRCHSLIEKD
jgi:hypothetical protein